MLGQVSVRNSLQYFIWLKSKTVKVYSIVKSVKLLLVLSIYSSYLWDILVDCRGNRCLDSYKYMYMNTSLICYFKEAIKIENVVCCKF